MRPSTLTFVVQGICANEMLDLSRATTVESLRYHPLFGVRHHPLFGV